MHGETLIETMAAMLVATFALLMMAGCVTTSTKIISRSKEKIGKYMQQDAIMTSGSCTSMTVTITEQETIEPMTQSFQVKYYENPVKLGNTSVGRYTTCSRTQTGSSTIPEAPDSP